MAARLVALALVVAACSSGSKTGPAEQSFADAVRILCGEGPSPPDVTSAAPAERHEKLSRWLDAQIRHPQGRALLAALATAPDPAGRVRTAADEAGVAGCRPLAMFAPRFASGVELAELAGDGGTVDVDQELPVITASTTAVIVDGKPVVPIAGGAIAAGDQATLASMVGAVGADHAETTGAPFAGAVVAMDGGLSTPVLAQIERALVQAGAKRLELLVRVGGGLRAVPFDLPDAKRPGQLVLVVQNDKVVVASRSGRDGALGPPRMSVPIDPLPAVAGPLQDTLAQIDRPAERLTVIAADSVRIGVLAQLAAWARARPDGTPVMPDVALGTGLEY
jgi:hypothetical protein